MLDGITTAAAYSLRKLYTASPTNCVLLRRNSDNAEQNFGYTPAGDLDTGAVAAWLGGALAYVKTWYDQSGNSLHMSQATAARQIPLTLSDATLNNRPTLNNPGGSPVAPYMSATSVTLMPSNSGSVVLVGSSVETPSFFVRNRCSAGFWGTGRGRLTVNDGAGHTQDIGSNDNVYPTDGTWHIPFIVWMDDRVLFYNRGVFGGLKLMSYGFVESNSSTSLFGIDIGTLSLKTPEIIFFDGPLSVEICNLIGASQAAYYGGTWTNVAAIDVLDRRGVVEPITWIVAP